MSLSVFRVIAILALLLVASAAASSSTAGSFAAQLATAKRVVLHRHRREARMDVEKKGDVNRCVDQLEQLRAYYAAVKAERTVNKGHYTVDCVPFDQQPSLLFASEGEKSAAWAKFHETHAKGVVDSLPAADVESMFEFKPDECPDAMTIPLARPVVRLGRTQRASQFVCPVAIRKHQKSARSKALSSEGDQGYRWYQNTPAGTTGDQSSVVLGVGPELGVPFPSVPGPSDGDYSHSLNQMWWMAFNNGEQSLEGGWIVSSYTTVNVSSCLFVFSTPDAYQGSQYDQYDTAGGFIQTNKNVPLGLPMKNIRFEFTYWIRSNGVEIDYTVRPFSTSLDFTGPAVTMGYYNTSRFAPYGSAPVFNQLSNGAEADIAFTTSTVSMGGRILGSSNGGQLYPVYGNYGLLPQGSQATFTGTYGSQTWSGSSQPVGGHYVEFGGVVNVQGAKGKFSELH